MEWCKYICQWLIGHDHASFWARFSYAIIRLPEVLVLFYGPGYESEFTRIRSYNLHLGPQIDRERFNGGCSVNFDYILDPINTVQMSLLRRFCFSPQ